MKITLIQPPKPVHNLQAEGHWELARPFSLFFLASAIENDTRFEVQILDLENKKYRNISLAEIFHNNHSQIFGITATTYTRFEAVKIAKFIKTIQKNALVVAGGVHFMHCAEDTLMHVPEIDIVVRGEGESTIVELANSIDKGQSFENIRGITYRKNGKIVANQDRDTFEDLDNVPFYSKFSWEEYPEYLFGYPERIRATSIMSSRGCPFNCIFCSKAGTKYRVRNANNVVDEIQLLQERFGIEGINFLDLTFTADTRHTRAVCQEMIKRNLGLKWWCESRANIPLDLLEIMKQAGCVSTVIGVESGSKRIISSISKNVSVDQVLAFCTKCSDLEILVTPYFMFSHPGETKKDLQLTIDLIFKLEEMRGVGPCALQPTMIFPGTEIERISYAKGLLEKDFSWYMPYHSDLNAELGQLINIPIFLDKLNANTLIDVDKEMMFRRTVNEVYDMRLSELIVKGCRALTKNPSLLKYIISPRFYYACLVNKIKSLSFL